MNLEVVIKTFERPQKLSGLLDTIAAHYPQLKVWIVDDSESHYRPTRDTERVIRLPFDVGKLCARQVALSYVKAPFVLMLDDDFLVDERTNIPKLLDIAQRTGSLFTGGDVWDFTDSRARSWFGRFDYLENAHLATGPAKWNEGDEWIEVDMMTDFYVVHVSQLMEIGGYDCRLKIGGSLEVFLRAYLAKKKSVFVPDVIIGHAPGGDERYNTFRNRCTKDLSQFWKPIAEQEYGLKWFPP